MLRTGCTSRRNGTAFALLALFCAAAMAQNAEEKLNMALAGHHGLSGRSAYQPVIERQGARWIAYVGHHGGSALNPLSGANEANGTSVLDVTDPKKPKLLAHIPGQGGGAQMVRACSTLPKAPGRTFLLRTLGHSAQEIWETTDPAKPVRIVTVAEGLADTHKNWWECDTGIAYLVSGAKGWRSSRMLQIYDLSNPAKPLFIRNFGLPGMQPGAGSGLGARRDCRAVGHRNPGRGGSRFMGRRLQPRSKSSKRDFAWRRRTRAAAPRTFRCSKQVRSTSLWCRVNRRTKRSTASAARRRI